MEVNLCFCIGRRVNTLIFPDFPDYCLFCLKISAKIIFRLDVLVPLRKELVAGSTESLPDLFRFLARYSTDFLPLLLKSNELV